MTTIAYRNGFLAADTMSTNGSAITGEVVKIVRRADGHLAGAVGDLTFAQKFLTWFMAGEGENVPLPKQDDGMTEGVGIIQRPSGEIVSFESGGSNTVTADYWAAGSGRDFALGAMASGADANDAVRAAIKHDVYSGGSVTVLAR